MDPDSLRQLGFFSVPDNQTANPSTTLPGSSAQPLPSIWDTVGLRLDTGFAASPSTAPTTVSFDSASQLSPLTSLTTMSPDLMSASPTQRIQSRPVLPARGPNSRERRGRKRSRLSIDASTPLDSVDYWLNFDENDGLAGIPEETESPKPAAEAKRSLSAATRSTKPTPPPPAVLKRTEHFDDDSALDNALSDDFDDDDAGFSSINLADQLSKIETAPPQDVPPREGLYSTPLSWERPQPAIRPESFHGLQSPYLSEAEQRRLIAIAMTPGPSTGGLGSSMNFNFGGLGAGMGSFLGSGFGSSDTAAEGPKPVSPPQAAAALHSKKKGSVSEKAKEALKSGERTAHNDIERKYRTNLKDKIAELRDAVPALRTISEDGGEDDGAQPSKTAKLSKGTVLTKATEYIHLLERQNKQIVQQHRELSRRLQAFEQLLTAAARSSYAMPTYSRTLFDPRGFC